MPRSTLTGRAERRRRQQQRLQRTAARAQQEAQVREQVMQDDDEQRVAVMAQHATHVRQQETEDDHEHRLTMMAQHATHARAQRLPHQNAYVARQHIEQFAEFPRAHFCGPMDRMCQYCQAKYFPEEVTTRHHFTKCCHSGATVLQALLDPSQIVQDLFSGTNLNISLHPLKIQNIPLPPLLLIYHTTNYLQVHRQIQSISKTTSVTTIVPWPWHHGMHRYKHMPP